MSTLAAARADNFYYPPDHDPSKGGLNRQQGQHPLRERAKKLDQGILVIRFEMPFNVWCAGCNHLIGKGVRFNAEKKQIGNYHSSKIWSFSMRAPCCGQRIEVQTDPKNAEYIIASGGRRKMEEFSSEDAQTIHLPDAEERAQLMSDPLSRLEHDEAAKAIAREDAVRMSDLRTDSDARWKDDYVGNKALRRRLRAVRKADQQRDEQRAALGLPEAVKLLPPSPEDAAVASLMVFGDPDAHEKNWKKRRHAIQTQSIFAQPARHKQSAGQLSSATVAGSQTKGSSTTNQRRARQLNLAAVRKQAVL